MEIQIMGDVVKRDVLFDATSKKTTSRGQPKGTSKIILLIDVELYCIYYKMLGDST